MDTTSMPLLRTDRALLDRFRAGEQEALGRVYWEYARKVERLLSAGFEIRGRGIRVSGAFRQPDDLADLVQDVFMRAFSERGRRAYDGLRDYGPYLYAMARNVLVDWARVRGREIPAPWAELEAAVEMTPVIEDEEPWADPATMRVVEEYLANLPQHLREAHKLRHEEGLSQEDAAQRLGVGRQTLRTLERDLRDGLEAALSAAGICPRGQPESPRVRSENGQVRTT
jgi:RNA polymerase sigma-70 factor (ECF subfamily)